MNQRRRVAGRHERSGANGARSRDRREGFRPRARRAAAFTLFEILLVVALIGLFSAIFVVNFESLLRQTESDAVESAFWEAARAARTRALVDREAQSLRFDEKAAAFIVEDPAGAGAKQVRIDRDSWLPDTRLEVAFQKRLPANQFSLVGGELVQMREIPAVKFFPDGTCTPFTLSVQVAATEHTIDIDPWTGAQLLDADED